MTIGEAAKALGLLKMVVEGRMLDARWVVLIGPRSSRSRGLVCDRSAVQAGYVQPITEPRLFPGMGVGMVEVDVDITPEGLSALASMGRRSLPN